MLLRCCLISPDLCRSVKEPFQHLKTHYGKMVRFRIKSNSNKSPRKTNQTKTRVKVFNPRLKSHQMTSQ